MSAAALLNCAKAAPSSTGSGGSHGSGGSSASGGSNGSGGNNYSGGNNGSGGSSSSGGNSASGGNGSGGSVSSGGNTGSGGSSSSGGASGSGGSSSSGGNTGSGGSSSGGSTGSGGSIVTNMDGGTDASCQTASLTWAPQIPSVMILVDRSGSEFTDATTGVFFTLRTAVEAVVANLQSQVRFGLASFVGDHSSGACKLNYLSVPIAQNNSAAIKTAYDGWGPLLPFGSKADTPAIEAIPMVQAALTADTGTGAKYMMLVTDGETDFCDDGNALCPADAVTAAIQNMYSGTPSIGTMVVSIADSSTSTALYQTVIQNFANAGVGQNATIPTGIGASTGMDVYNQCNGQGTAAGTSSWSNLLSTAGKSMTSLATYASPAGTATVYSPSSTSETALENAISAAINGVKSCTFDLSNVGGKSIKVDLTQLAKATITIENNVIPQDATNGWSMSSSTELVLNGSACTTWRMPNTTHINFGFPCSVIIFE